MLSTTLDEAVDPRKAAWYRIDAPPAALRHLAHPGVVIGISLVVLALIGNHLTVNSADSIAVAPPLTGPSSGMWFGSDELGRDVFARALVGLRISLIVGAASAGVAALIGVLVGAAAGFYGGVVDDLLMRATELVMVVPRFFLAVLIVAMFGTSLVNMISAIAVLAWPIIARIVRADVMSVRHRQFVDAARILGVGTLRLVMREILPNALTGAIVATTLGMGDAILLQAALSYLGLGDPSQASLGLMLQEAQPIMRVAWWTAAFPGVLVFLAVLSSNLLGDRLQDWMNPRAK